MRTAFGVVVFALLAIAFAPAPAAAKLIVPNTFADDFTNNGNCTLREAVAAANTDAPRDACTAGIDDDGILLSPGTYELSIPASAAQFDPATGGLVVDDPGDGVLTIAGTGQGATIDANGNDRTIAARSPLNLSNLTVTGGDAGEAEGATGAGGAVWGDGGVAIGLSGVLLNGNDATTTGGGVHAAGPLVVSNSTISQNDVVSATDGGGGGIHAAGTTSITRSTITANTADAGNNAATGGGVQYTGTLTLTGSIVTGNAADGGGAQCGGPGTSSGGFNVISSTAGCNFTATGTDDVGGNAALGSLADNGGPTRTYALSESSDALDIGPAAAVAGCAGTADARGVPRGNDGLNATATGPCDAGSYERASCGSGLVNKVGTSASDVLAGPPSPIGALGLAGSDSLAGTSGDDHLCGGAGADFLSGGPGADLLDGGPGTDTAVYSNAATGVVVSLDGVANDGEPGENDNALVESVIGSPSGDAIAGDDLPNGVIGGDGNDVIAVGGEADSVFGKSGADNIAGGLGADLLDGGDGSDVIEGGGGADKLSGKGGADALDGGQGSDRVFGGDGKDVVEGGGGRDSLQGEGGKDVLVGGSGNDVLVGGPGADKIRCGSGTDRVIADRRDKINRDCEKVKRR